MPIKAFVSDFAGVLAEDGLQKTLGHYAEARGIPIDSVQEANRKYWIPFSLGKISESYYWSRLLGEFGMEGTQVQIKEAQEYLREAHVPYHGMLEFFRSPKGSRKTGLMTNNTREWLDYFYKKFGLSRIFDVVVSSHECGARKPSRKIYEITLERLGTKAEETVFIDDQPQNLEPARQIGMVAVHFESPEQAIAELKRLAEA